VATKKEKKRVATTPKEGEVEQAKSARSLTPFDEMERMFDRMRGDLLSGQWMHPFSCERPAWGEMMRSFEGRFPRADVIDRDGDILVRAEVPGIAKEDLEISVTGNSVTIKGESKQEEREERGDYYRCETSRGAFSRTIALPVAVNADAAKASFENGMLELTLPKTPKDKRRTIKVD